MQNKTRQHALECIQQSTKQIPAIKLQQQGTMATARKNSLAKNVKLFPANLRHKASNLVTTIEKVHFIFVSLTFSGPISNFATADLRKFGRTPPPRRI